MSGLKRLMSAAAAAVMTATLLAANVSAKESYDPYSYDRWGDAVASQVGYTAEAFIDGQLIKGLSEKVDELAAVKAAEDPDFDINSDDWKSLKRLKEPNDIFISHDDLIYIADKGNDRVIATDFDFKLVHYFSEFEYNGETLKLKKPEGVFVDQYTGFVYICDTENSRVLKVSTDGEIDRIFSRPKETGLYSEELTYNPRSVCVDKAGNVYVVVRSVTKGAVMFNSEGEFKGFFGANRVEATSEIIMNAFWNTIATEEQRKRSTRATPVGFTNFDIDDDGFIYTVTESSDVVTDTVKKLNPRGANILAATVGDEVQFGDNPPAYYSIHSKNSRLMDIDIGPDGVMNILDNEHGRVFQYDKLANLMFVIGGNGSMLGTFNNVSAVESRDNLIYVLDAGKGGITIFERTSFGEIVTEATNKYNDGYYSESLEPWLNVIKYDGNYRRAYIGIGNALLNDEQYKEAMKYFKIAIARNRYNKAYEGYRGQILEKYFTPAIITIIVLVVLIKVIKTLNKKGIITFPWQRKGGV